MRRPWLYGGLGLALVLALGAQWISASWVSPSKVLPDKPLHRIEPAPMCPWRQPETDLRALFPGATGYQTEMRILSGQRLELTRRLGRPPTAEEHSVYVHHIYHARHPLGTVMTRRVKGEYGAIELVLAVGTDGRVRGLRLQRLREPESIASALGSTEWRRAFEGKSARSEWRLGQDIPQVPAEARGSAQAVVEGARSLLILLETAQQPGIPIRSS